MADDTTDNYLDCITDSDDVRDVREFKRAIVRALHDADERLASDQLRERVDAPPGDDYPTAYDRALRELYAAGPLVNPEPDMWGLLDGTDPDHVDPTPDSERPDWHDPDRHPPFDRDATDWPLEFTVYAHGGDHADRRALAEHYANGDPAIEKVLRAMGREVELTYRVHRDGRVTLASCDDRTAKNSLQWEGR